MATKTDWEPIERDFRAGVLSVRQVAKNHDVTEGAIRKKAKAEGWERDLTERVREAARIKLVRETVRKEMRTASADSIVEDASDILVSVELKQRAYLNRLSGVASGLMAAIEARLAAAQSGDTDDPALTASFAIIGEKETVADVMEKVSRTLAKVIPLERQAFNMDKPEAPDIAPAGDAASDAEVARRLAFILTKASKE